MLIDVFKHHWLKYSKCKNAQKYENQQCTLKWDALTEYDFDFMSKSVVLSKGHFWECVFSFVEHAALCIKSSNF